MSKIADCSRQIEAIDCGVDDALGEARAHMLGKGVGEKGFGGGI
jgi:hypothetical protein